MNRMQIPEPQQHTSVQLSQDTNNCVTTVARVRPSILQEPQEQFVINSNPYSYVLQKMQDRFGKEIFQQKKFLFDHTFSSTDSNNTVYNSIGFSQILNLFVHGGIGTVMAFGQTSSGKTYTMNYIQQHFLSDIMNYQSNCKLCYSLQYIQILGEKCTDLLNNGVEVKIMEDKFGAIQVVGAKIIEIQSLQQAQQVIQYGQSARITDTTKRNTASSRSHAILSIFVHNSTFTLLEDGVMHFVDLAGSEGARDMEMHNREQMKEAAAINTSLSVLKDCLRNRTLASGAEGQKRHIHIPYRNSKLTLLLKSSFEMSSTQHSHTVVIATTTPCENDCRMSISTLQYVEPIKVAVNKEYVPKPDIKNPTSWTADQVNEWISTETLNRIKPESLTLGQMTGLQLCRISEGEFIERAMTNKGVGEKYAKSIYVKLWGLVVDAKEKKRKEDLKPLKSKKQREEESLAMDLELIRRTAAGL